MEIQSGHNKDYAEKYKKTLLVFIKVVKNQGYNTLQSHILSKHQELNEKLIKEINESKKIQ